MEYRVSFDLNPLSNAPYPGQRPPLPPPTGQLMQRIRDGQACSYCPEARKRPAVVPLYASEVMEDGSVRYVVRFVCGACEIQLRDLVLGAPGQAGLQERVRELEGLVEQLQAEVRDAVALARGKKAEPTDGGQPRG